MHSEILTSRSRRAPLQFPGLFKWIVLLSGPLPTMPRIPHFTGLWWGHNRTPMKGGCGTGGNFVGWFGWKGFDSKGGFRVEPGYAGFLHSCQQLFEGVEQTPGGLREKYLSHFEATFITYKTNRGGFVFSSVGCTVTFAATATQKVMARVTLRFDDSSKRARLIKRVRKGIITGCRVLIYSQRFAHLDENSQAVIFSLST